MITTEKWGVLALPASFNGGFNKAMDNRFGQIKDNSCKGEHNGSPFLNDIKETARKRTAVLSHNFLEGLEE